MKLLSLLCVVLLATAVAGRPAAQMARGSGTATASVIDTATIGAPAVPSLVSRFQAAFDVAAFLADPASGVVVLPRGAGAPVGAGTGSQAVAAPQLTVERNPDGSVSVAVAGGSNLSFSLTQAPSGGVSVEYN